MKLVPNHHHRQLSFIACRIVFSPNRTATGETTKFKEIHSKRLFTFPFIPLCVPWRVGMRWMCPNRKWIVTSPNSSACWAAGWCDCQRSDVDGRERVATAHWIQTLRRGEPIPRHRHRHRQQYRHQHRRRNQRKWRHKEKCAHPRNQLQIQFPFALHDGTSISSTIWPVRLMHGKGTFRRQIPWNKTPNLLTSCCVCVWVLCVLAGDYHFHRWLAQAFCAFQMTSDDDEARNNDDDSNDNDYDYGYCHCSARHNEWIDDDSLYRPGRFASQQCCTFTTPAMVHLSLVASILTEIRFE